MVVGTFIANGILETIASERCGEGANGEHCLKRGNTIYNGEQRAIIGIVDKISQREE